MSYAENTSVSVEKTRAEIEKLIIKAGAAQFVSGIERNRAVIGFTLDNRQIRFFLTFPDPQSDEFIYTKAKRYKRTDDQAYAAWEQACRAKWRALYLIIKAKLEAVDSGITTIEREFLANIVLPDGKTAGEWMLPQIEDVYNTGKMPNMLPMLNSSVEDI